jgi:hypothetical protein
VVCVSKHDLSLILPIITAAENGSFTVMCEACSPAPFNRPNQLHKNVFSCKLRMETDKSFRNLYAESEANGQCANNSLFNLLK